MEGGGDVAEPVVEALTSFGARDLFILYGALMRELLRRGLVRTANAPVGDYAEYLVAKACAGELASNSEKSWDVKTPAGRRVQVKSRVLASPPKVGERQLSPFRSYDFDDLVIVLFEPDYSVRRAVQLPLEEVKHLVRFRSHVNGNVLMASDAVLSSSGATDITEMIRTAAS